MKTIAVLDIGKTNVKLALVDTQTWQEVEVKTRPNQVLPGPPWPHFDLEGHWEFFLSGLRALNAQTQIDAISVSAHGAALTLIDKEGRALPMMDYEDPDLIEDADYNARRPSFEETGSPRLPLGLNAGAQLHHMFGKMPTLKTRLKAIVPYPQYWSYRLCGKLASDVTSLGCHTDLWEPYKNRFSTLVDTLGICHLMAPPRRPDEVLGHITTEVAQRTGLNPQTPVAVGIHDSNASLYPHLCTRDAPFCVVSTGTWVISMAIGGAALRLDPRRDTLLNVNALSNPVPTARFMGGREFEQIIEGAEITATPEDREAVLTQQIMLLPSVIGGTGPFPDRSMEWTAPPQTHGQRLGAVSYYLALMTLSSTALIGARGPLIIEGPFAGNRDYIDMLRNAHQGDVETSPSSTGTSIGAAMLLSPTKPRPLTHPAPSQRDPRLAQYAKLWSEKVALA